MFILKFFCFEAVIHEVIESTITNDPLRINCIANEKFSIDIICLC